MIGAAVLGLGLAVGSGVHARDMGVQGGPGGTPSRLASDVIDLVNSITIHRGAWVDAITVNYASHSRRTHELLAARNMLHPAGGAGGTTAADVCPQHTYISGPR